MYDRYIYIYIDDKLDLISLITRIFAIKKIIKKPVKQTDEFEWVTAAVPFNVFVNLTFYFRPDRQLASQPVLKYKKKNKHKF